MMNQPVSRLAYFPVTLFAAVMGISGLALAWHKLDHMLNLSVSPAASIALIAALVFVLLSVVYTLKFIRHREQVALEFQHPVKANFFATISISILLLAILSLMYSPGLAKVLFVLGALIHLSFTMLIFSRWIFSDKHQNPHLTPAWFIPVVGNILVPIVAVPLGHVEIGWFFFSIGIVFWIVLFTILMHRLFFLDPMPVQLAPTLFILIAPPAIGFVSYVTLNGFVDNFAQVLYGVALFITLFLLLQFARFHRLPFFLSWWAYSFPLASMSIASLLYFEQTQYKPVYWIGIALLAFTSVLIIGLLIRTLIAMKNKQICLPE